ncbi:hypothetical protein [Nocardiopsis alkaliphila]|uniref:hypothetical protein n=1 Tax=Nocardiopsis alkaliphila TaxID=225762 RepID=UPI0012694C7C|nr:hypothetical protein [Nocardiopsis alkaliphila]
MSDTTAEEKSKPREPAKKGLHGWKAALAVFGCGTLAAFGVFGVVLALLGTLVSSISQGVAPEKENSVPPVVDSVEPREEFLEDKFDLCAIIDSISAAGLNLEPGYPEPLDKGFEGGSPSQGDLVRSGECSGKVLLGSAQYDPLDFYFSYRSIVFHPMDGKDDVSREDLELWKSEFEQTEINISQSGPSGFMDEAYYFYGIPGGGSGSFYHLVSRKRSSVISMHLSSPQEVPISAYQGAVNKFERRLDEDLNGYIPE